tara:strand:+ start:19860 stop:20033 length:174 start_codon:yes stop_codon:yes gene_type:complete
MFATRISEQDGLWFVLFGQMDGLEFRCSHGQPGRSYKTFAGAVRAVIRWEKKNEDSV